MNQGLNVPKGFTLLELLIVIAILAILAVIAIFTLNPAETLREARDSQRISDLATLKTAVALYLTATTTARLDNNAGNTTCKGGTGQDKIYYSYPNDSPGAAITDGVVDGTASSSQVANSALYGTDATGWIPVNLAGLGSGSPISNLPVDPTNEATTTNVTAGDLIYRYMCNTSDITFEINANLESKNYSAKESTDGGNNSSLYEVGTKLTIMGTGTDF